MKIILFVVVISIILGVIFMGIATRIIFKKRKKAINFHKKTNKDLTDPETYSSQS